MTDTTPPAARPTHRRRRQPNQIFSSDIYGWQRCPYSHRLLRVDPQPIYSDDAEEPYLGWRIGSAVHEIAELVWKHGIAIGHVGPLHTPAIMSKASEITAEQIAKHNIPPDSQGEVKAQVVDYLLAQHEFVAGNILGVEVFMSARLDSGYTASSKADRVERGPGRDHVIVIDIKARRPNDEPLEQNTQGRIALVAAASRWPWARRLTFRHDYTGSREQIGYSRDRHEVDWIARQIDGELSPQKTAMENGPWPADPSPRNCGKCEFGPDGRFVCPAAGGTPDPGQPLPDPPSPDPRPGR